MGGFDTEFISMVRSAGLPGGEDHAPLALPAELPVLGLSDIVIFPGNVSPLLVDSGASVRLVDDVVAGDRLVCLVLQKNAEVSDPAPEDLHEVGCVARVLKMLKYPDETARILVEGQARVRLGRFTQREPYLRAEVTLLVEKAEDSPRIQAMARSLERNAFVAGRFEGERLNSARVLRSRRLDQQDGLQWSSPAVGMPHAGAGNLGVRRDVFLAAGGFDARLQHLEDTDLCWRIQRTGVPLVFAPEVVVHVRLRSTLRGMFRQGRSYGRAQADLERRYVVGARPLSATGVDDPPSVALRPLGRRPVALLRAVGGELKGFVAGGGVGRQIWRIGWYVGHHGRVEP